MKAVNEARFWLLASALLCASMTAMVVHVAWQNASWKALAFLLSTVLTVLYGGLGLILLFLAIRWRRIAEGERRDRA
jgi:hypothetical protein